MSPPVDQIRVVIVDDHPIVRTGLRAVLEAEADIEVVAEAADPADATAAVATRRPDVVLLDLHLGEGRSGLDVLDRIDPTRDGRVLVVTVFDNDQDIQAALRAGAAGYLLKDAPEDELVRAVRAVAAGGSPLGPSVATRILARDRPGPDAPSPRELEVLAAVADGDDNVTIARRLYISQATVKSHLASIFTKFGVATRTGAVAEARRRGHMR